MNGICLKSKICTSRSTARNPQRPRPHREKGQVHAIMGPNGSGKSTLAYVLAGKAGYDVTEGDILLDGEDMLALDPDERAAKGLFLAFQYPLEIPGVATMTFLRTALNAQRKTRGEAGAFDAGIHEAGARRRRQARHRPGHAAARGQCRLLRRREEAQRDPADGDAGAAACGARRDRFRPRHRRAEDRGRRRQPAALAGARVWSSSRTISGCSTTSCRTWCMCFRGAAS